MPAGSSSKAACAVAFIAVAVYLNTLPGDFTFDDNFALITNHDVWNTTIPLQHVFRHDFWGQDISSPQSHKSYRPITILLFRGVYVAWTSTSWLLPWLTRPLLRGVQALGTGPSRELPAGLHPFPFHVLNVLMNAAASVLVLLLAQQLFACLEGPPPRPSATPLPAAGPSQPRQPAARGGKQSPGPPHKRGANNSSSSRGADAGGRGVEQWEWSEWLQWRWQPCPWRVGSPSAQLQAWVCALLFALHPVHTEAVAGIVGHAELLCAVLSIPGLMAYMMAVDGRYAGAAASRPPAATAASALQRWQQREALQHWLLVAAAVGLAWLAALSKEIGITVIGTMILYDVVAGATGDRAARRRQLLRLGVLLGVGALYVLARTRVAGDHLVRIYRKVENPIPFCEERLTRLLTTGYLHARYALLLLAPWHLSCDWSFACIPLVEAWSDPRNLATAGLYAGLVYVLLAARPLGLAVGKVKEWWGCLRSSPDQEQDPQQQQQPAGAGAGQEAGLAGQEVSLWRARVRLLVVLGLIVGPFFPATNILFYVGTFIGERLLYYPSIGYCWLVADLLGMLLLSSSASSKAGATGHADGHNGTTVAAGAAAAASTTSSSSSNKTGAAGLQGAAPDAPPEGTPITNNTTHSSSSGGVWRKMVLLGVVGVVLVAYAGRTWLRNMDWVDEGALFVAAQKVCPDSAKVQHNSGILERRHGNFDMALWRFRRAQEIVPSYCEPTYWLGLTQVNLNKPHEGMELLRKAVGCKYTAADALSALGQIYQVMMSNHPSSLTAVMEWARLLAGPTVLRLAEACSAVEDGARMAAANRMGAAAIEQVLEVCSIGLKEYDTGYAQPDSLPATSPDYKQQTGVNSTLLRRCVLGRRPLYHVLSQMAPTQPAARRALYKYLRAVHRLPGCRTSGFLRPQVEPSSAHQKMLHVFQSADPEDPWLQWEWGETLMALNDSKLREATTHMEVSAVMFMQIATRLATNPSDPTIRHTQLDGKPWNISAAAEAAMQPLLRLKQWNSAPQDKCAVQQRMCHIRLQVLQMLQAPDPAAGVAAQAAAKKTQLAGKAATRRCLAELASTPECREQALQLDKLLIRVDPEHAQARAAEEGGVGGRGGSRGGGRAAAAAAAQEDQEDDSYDGEL